MCCGAEGVSGGDAASSHDLASMLEEVSRLRVQLEHCVNSNDRLRHTLRKCGTVTALSDDSHAVSASQQDGKLLLLVCVNLIGCSAVNSYCCVLHCVCSTPSCHF